MTLYKIAGVHIAAEPQYPETIDRMEPYRCDGGEADFSVEISPEELADFTASSNFPDRPDMNEGPLLYTKICKRMLSEYDGFFFHSSALELDGEGYLFTALSGTGKSTHTRNWRRLFGDRVTMINDDKPIIRKIDGRFYVCGTPWMGKSNIGCNRMAPVAVGGDAPAENQGDHEQSAQSVQRSVQLSQADLAYLQQGCGSRAGGI